MKVLFMIHDLSVGGAEKVLVNLVNHLDPARFEVTVCALFGGGVNEQFLRPHVHRYHIWEHAVRGNSHLMKLLTPAQLHRLCVRDHYDVEIAYLEGSAARIISGCPDPMTKLIAWIHVEQHTAKCAAGAFRDYDESRRCYERFDEVVCVSEFVRGDFQSIYPGLRHCSVYYNTNETVQILEQMREPVADGLFRADEIKLVGVGKLGPNKGFDRMARILKRLRDEGYPVHWYALGIGPEKERIEKYLKEQQLEPYFTFLGYQTNPYKYVARCDLFVCASRSEGFSTAATEALIVGTPVCTVAVSGMWEMLGEDNEFGVVTENDDEALFQGVRDLIADPMRLAYYARQAELRGRDFSCEKTVEAVEQLLERMIC